MTFFLPLFFLIHVVGMVLTENAAVGAMKLETKALFLLFPIALVSTDPISTQDFKSIMLSFVAACFLATLICFSNSLWMVVQQAPFVNFGNTGLDTYEALNKGASANWMYFTYIGLASGINLHPTYFGLYLICCQLILLFFYLTPGHFPDDRRIRYLLVASFIYLLLFVVLLSSRIILAGELVVVAGAIIYLTKRNGKIAAASSIVVVATALFVAFGSPVTRYRAYQELMATPVGQHPPPMADNSVSIRASLWWISGQVLAEMPLLTGVGTGDTHDTMRAAADRYNAHNVLDSYDPHNQFIYTLISTGLAGLIVLVAGFVTFLVMTWRDKYFICFGFLMVFIVTCLTESVLELQKGVVLFTFFVSGYTWLSGKGDQQLNQRS